MMIRTWVERCVVPGLIAAVALACGEVAMDDMGGMLRDAGEMLLDAGVAMGADAGPNDRDGGRADAGKRMDAGSNGRDSGNLLIDAAGSLIDAAGQLGNDASAQSSCGACSTGGTLRIQQAQFDPEQQVVGPLPSDAVVEFFRRESPFDAPNDEVALGYRIPGPLVITRLWNAADAVVAPTSDTSCGFYLSSANAEVQDALNRLVISGNPEPDLTVSTAEPIVVGEGEALCVAVGRAVTDGQVITDPAIAFASASVPRWRGFRPYP